ncbi:thermolysin metallopeptidase [Legionella beliardensis]|uniref:Neutral metalloproteinase n=1 Tax=Legionella beliardensis TaxID=91822 RepID=A0A378HZY5_9GAMM|nr:M4 family metallopeptidase [Legionella beliardensis]STX27866.1 thermolysin metallopeptidase [Legionella beliardensis]
MKLPPYNRIAPIFLSSLLALATADPIYASDQVFTDDENVSGYDINAVVGLGQSYDFKLMTEVTLPNGVNKHKFLQYYLGVPVWGMSLSATKLDNGELNHITGKYLVNIEEDLASVVPTLSKEQAFTIAVNSKNLSPKAKASIVNQESNTYVMQDNQQKARLIYEVSFMIEGDKPSRPFFIIDANSGEIIDQWEGLTTSKNAIGPGGNQKTGQYNYGTDYGFLIVSDTCQMSSPNVDTYDMKNLTSGGVLHQFSCTGNPPINTYKLTNGAFSPINDAHYFGNVVFDMYKQWFNKSPLTMKLKLRVHYGNNYENAFWDGQQMTFGDGYTRFYPLVSMDVVAHEVSHGFTQQNSNLVYSGQPGGINEAFSDMAGEATEYFTNPSKPEGQRNDWLVGGTIMKNGVALRYFDDPTKDGRSIGHAKDYRDGLNVHYSSGVFNKAYYTIAKKPTWNTEKAFRIFVLANQIYWNRNSNFVDAACGVKKAGQDLGYNTQDIVDAFNVVGVDASCDGTNPTETELKNGVPVANLSGTKGDEKHWYVNVPAGKSVLTVKISGGTGDADLYVQFGEKPTTTKFQCRPYKSGNAETCTFNSPQAGKYYVMVRAYANYSGVTLATTY